MAITDFPIQTVNLSSLGIGQLKFVSNYASFEAAISSIGSTPTTLIIDEDTTVSTAAVIPTTLTFAQWNQSVLSKSGSGTIEFEGLGLQNPTAQQPIFLGFEAGDITWTGTNTPTEISTELWDTGNSSLTERLQCVNDAFSSAYIKIIAYPRTSTGTITFDANKAIHFMAGEYPCSIATNIYPFVFNSNFTATAEIGAIIRLPQFGGAGFRPVSVETVIYDIIFDGLHLKADDNEIGDPANSNLIIGNAHNGIIRNCIFENSQQYTVVGGVASGASAESSLHCQIYNNRWINCSTQSLAILSSIDTVVSNNYWTVRDIPAASSGTLIDVEPNDNRDVVENLVITNNVFDMQSAPAFYISAIAVRAVIVPNIKNLTITNNTILGDASYVLTGFMTGINVSGATRVHIAGNQIVGATSAIDLYNCTDVSLGDNIIQNCVDVTGRESGIHMYGVHNAVVQANNINNSKGIYETELENPVTASGSTVTTAQYGFYDFWVGLTFLLNDTTYTVATVLPITVSNVQQLTTTVSVGTLTNGVMSNRSGDTITVTAHGFNNGAAVRYVAGTAAISGLTDLTTYYIIKVTNDTFKLATTRANALANTPITLSSSGTGTQTFKPILQTRFSNNKYIYNVAEFVTVEPTGTSQVAPIAYE